MDIFGKIINRSLLAEIIFEDDFAIAIKDIKPRQKGHFLVIPKQFSENIFDIENNTLSKLIVLAKKLAIEQVKILGATGFKTLINSGKSAHQEVMRTHIHIIPYYQ